MSNPSRINKYKNNGKGKDEQRAKRAEMTVELRKAHRDEQLSKRRNFKVEDDDEMLLSPSENNAACALLPSPSSFNIEALDLVVRDLDSNDVMVQLIACQAARKLLSRERSPPIKVVVAAGLVPRLVAFLDQHNFPALQFEAAWAVTNIASGTVQQTKEVVNAGAVPKLVKLLSSSDSKLVDQAVWALGNIAGDGPNQRDVVLDCQGMSTLVNLFDINMPVNFLRNLVWTVSNLCRNKNPPPNFDLVRPCLPMLHQLLFYNDREVVGDACWAISYLVDGPNEKIQAVVDEGIIQPLVQLLMMSEQSVLIPALRAVGNIVTGNDMQTECVIQAGVIGHLKVLLSQTHANLKKEAAWSLSNITAGNRSQIQAVIDEGLLSPLRDVLDKGDYRSRREAAWAVTNFSSGGTVDQILLLVEEGFIPPLCNLIVGQDWKLTMVVLDGLLNILQAAERMQVSDKVAELIEECGGLDKLETLQHHHNTEVYNKAVTIIECFFQEDPSEMDFPSPISDTGELNFEVLSTNNDNFSF